MSYLWALIVAHPLEAWGIVSALLSLLYTRLEAYPKTHAVLSTLASLGIDLPTMLAALRRLFSGALPPGRLMRQQARVTVDESKDPPTMAFKLMRASVFGVVFALAVVVTPSTSGCTAQQAQQVVQDVTPAGACIVGQVVNGVVDPLVVLAACIGTTVESILAVIETFLGKSPTAMAPTPFQKSLLLLKANTLALQAKDGGGQ